MDGIFDDPELTEQARLISFVFSHLPNNLYLQAFEQPFRSKRQRHIWWSKFWLWLFSFHPQVPWVAVRVRHGRCISWLCPRIRTVVAPSVISTLLQGDLPLPCWRRYVAFLIDYDCLDNSTVLKAMPKKLEMSTLKCCFCYQGLDCIGSFNFHVGSIKTNTSFPGQRTPGCETHWFAESFQLSVLRIATGIVAVRGSTCGPLNAEWHEHAVQMSCKVPVSNWRRTTILLQCRMLIVLQSFLADAVAVDVGSLPQSSLNFAYNTMACAFDIYSGALLRFLDIYLFGQINPSTSCIALCETI